MFNAIIDLDSVAFTIFHPNKVLDEFGIPLRKDNKFVYIDKTEDEILESTDQIMNDILSKSDATGYIGYIKGKDNYRYSVYPEYKANRHGDPPKYWNLTKQLLIDRWNAVVVNGIEVDDAVNITRLKVPNSFICAIDKDLLHLQGRHFNWRLNKWVNISEEEARVKFWKDMIIGQPIDNIKGIPGKGIKYTEKLFFEELGTPIEALILNEYIQYFDENKGIQEFYKNYSCLHILEDYEGFSIPEIRQYSKNVEELF